MIPVGRLIPIGGSRWSAASVGRPRADPDRQLSAAPSGRVAHGLFDPRALPRLHDRNNALGLAAMNSKPIPELDEFKSGASGNSVGHTKLVPTDHAEQAEARSPGMTFGQEQPQRPNIKASATIPVTTTQKVKIATISPRDIGASSVERKAGAPAELAPE